ncbi:unnamed protein product [Soboliphyme baturini]|uniref:SUEL-type lectin domain-containing protein n=1 Tax=Soboliphyme baturini TaxID=241478 RepID=A0A183IWQ2_9BILA|nr:unnamed protein product [Soboliphyme baturini]
MDHMLHTCVQKYGHVVYKSTACSAETPCTSEEAQSTLSDQGLTSSEEHAQGCITDEGYEMSIGEVKVICHVKHSCLKSEYGLIYLRQPCGEITDCSDFESHEIFDEFENLL